MSLRRHPKRASTEARCVFYRCFTRMWLHFFICLLHLVMNIKIQRFLCGSGLAIGLSLGVLIGIIIDDIGLGMMLGIAVGLCIGPAVGVLRKNRKTEEQIRDDEKQ